MRTLRPLGLRREALLLVPVTLLVLIAISAFTLFAYRSAIGLLAEERREEVRRQAELVARRLPPERIPSSGDLRALAPLALGVALLDEDGVARQRVGELAETDLLAPLEGAIPRESVAVGPRAGELEDRVAGFARRGPPERREIVRLDLPARRLAAQIRGLSVLTAVVVVVDLGLGLLVLLFLGRLLSPWERLLAEARRVALPEGMPEDEIAFLVETFRRSLEALARPSDPEADIAALQRALAPSLASGLLLLDRESRVLALNRAGEELLGVGAPAQPAPIGEVLSGQPQLLALLEDPVELPDRLECEIEVAGRRRFLGVTAHPLRRDDGAFRGRLVLFADLTEVRRRAGEERLETSLEEIATLTAGLAHELRNSLATLRGYLTLAGRDPGEGDLRDYLGEMRSEADHLQRILDDFLAFARPGSSRSEPVELDELVARAVADPALGSPGAKLVPIPGEVAPRIQGDEHLLTRALRNLLANAVEAQRAAGCEEPVEVCLEVAREEVELRVEDRGAGVPPAIRERVFLPFVTGRPDGVGLGLAVSHRIVALHGGRLELEDRPGGGTVARLRLPLAEPLP